MSGKDLETRLAEIEEKLETIQKTNRYPNRDCLTYKELAEAAGCSEGKIRKDEKQGIIIARYPNAKKRFHLHDVDRYLRGV